MPITQDRLLILAQAAQLMELRSTAMLEWIKKVALEPHPKEHTPEQILATVLWQILDVEHQFPLPIREHDLIAKELLWFKIHWAKNKKLQARQAGVRRLKEALRANPIGLDHQQYHPNKGEQVEGLMERSIPEPDRTKLRPGVKPPRTFNQEGITQPEDITASILAGFGLPEEEPKL